MSKDYLTAMPMMNRGYSAEERAAAAERLIALGVQRVFLALKPNCVLEPERGEELAALRENARYWRGRGFEVGAWLWAFYLDKEHSFVRMRSPMGKDARLSICPTDSAYKALMGSFLADLAKTGVGLIMFDDDLRYGFQDMGFGCVCKNHRRMIEKRLGRKVTAAELRTKLTSGGPDPVRSAFVAANGQALESFAAEMRRYVDGADPNIRMGFCACITSWDLDGTNPDRIARLLAGRTRPFYRLIGAPYWAAHRHWGNSLADVIDMERREAALRADPEIEIFSEGDTFPRPRFHTPASYLELFDIALRAAGGTDGILKYALDYTASPSYETGYLDAALADSGTYVRISRMFGNKTCVGVRAYDKPAKYEGFTIPKSLEGEEKVQELPFSATARFLAANSVPAVFSGEETLGAAFGDDAKAVPPEALRGGMILDARAALLLRANGTDVGVKDEGEAFAVDIERFVATGERVGIPDGGCALRLTLDEKAEVLSFYLTKEGERLPLSYRYRNAAGGSFLVFAYEGYFAPQDWFRVYPRQGQIRDFAIWCGSPLPVFCGCGPGLYLLAKTDGKTLAVGLFNLFPDPIRKPELTVAFPCEVLRALNCRASAEGTAVSLSTAIPAFGCAFLLLSAKKEQERNNK